jgi:hypothetical protein
MAKTITLTLPHSLGQDQARARIQSGIADARQQLGDKLATVEETWQGNHMEFRCGVMGQTITGRVDVQADSATLYVDLPWFLAALADRIRPRIEQEGRKLLE